MYVKARGLRQHTRIILVKYIWTGTLTPLFECYISLTPIPLFLNICPRIHIIRTFAVHLGHPLSHEALFTLFFIVYIQTSLSTRVRTLQIGTQTKPSPDMSDRNRRQTNLLQGFIGKSLHLYWIALPKLADVSSGPIDGEQTEIAA